MIYVLSGGGGSGCTLVVTGVAGDTCTITNSSTGKSKTKTFDANKQATFKGLATGTWTVKMTGSSGTATRSVTINADYTCTITYFSATINITYPAASTCVVTNSSGETVASDSNGSASSTKTFTTKVGAADTYTITSTSSDGASTATQDVVITTDGQSETVKMSYALYLLKDGVLATIGGTQLSLVIRSGSTQPTLKNGEISCQGTTSTNCPWRLKPAVDFTGYSTLVFNLKNVSQGGGSPRILGASSDEYTLGSYNKTALEASTTVTTTGQTDYSEVTVPIENYQQAMYVGSEGSGSFYIDTIYLR